MNKRIKARWIKALTSGRYKQARARLRQNTDDSASFCCLGVLCDLYRKSVGGEWDGPSFVVSQREARSALLPPTVAEWAEIDSNDPVTERTKTLSDLNDRGETFEYIAQRIEKYL